MQHENQQRAVPEAGKFMFGNVSSIQLQNKRPHKHSDHGNYRVKNVTNFLRACVAYKEKIRQVVRAGSDEIGVGDLIESFQNVIGSVLDEGELSDDKVEEMLEQSRELIVGKIYKSMFQNMRASETDMQLFAQCRMLCQLEPSAFELSAEALGLPESSFKYLMDRLDKHVVDEMKAFEKQRTPLQKLNQLVKCANLLCLTYKIVCPRNKPLEAENLQKLTNYLVA